MISKGKRFNVRVYGVLIVDEAILISDEFIHSKEITKLPGGGLEFGEGTIECVIREFKEELDIKIEVEKHLYTTDFFVTSAFNANSQVISVYYKVKVVGDFKIVTSHRKFDFVKKNGAQSFRWIKLKELSEKDFTFVIDQQVVKILKNT